MEVFEINQEKRYLVLGVGYLLSFYLLIQGIYLAVAKPGFIVILSGLMIIIGVGLSFIVSAKLAYHIDLEDNFVHIKTVFLDMNITRDEIRKFEDFKTIAVITIEHHDRKQGFWIIPALTKNYNILFSKFRMD